MLKRCNLANASACKIRRKKHRLLKIMHTSFLMRYVLIIHVLQSSNGLMNTRLTAEITTTTNKKVNTSNNNAMEARGRHNKTPYGRIVHKRYLAYRYRFFAFFCVQI